MLNGNGLNNTTTATEVSKWILVEERVALGGLQLPGPSSHQLRTQQVQGTVYASSCAQLPSVLHGCLPAFLGSSGYGGSPQHLLWVASPSFSCFTCTSKVNIVGRNQCYSVQWSAHSIHSFRNLLFSGSATARFHVGPCEGLSPWGSLMNTRSLLWGAGWGRGVGKSSTRHCCGVGWSPCNQRKIRRFPRRVKHLWQKLMGIKKEGSLVVVAFEQGLKGCVEFKSVEMESGECKWKMSPWRGSLLSRLRCFSQRQRGLGTWGKVITKDVLPWLFQSTPTPSILKKLWCTAREGESKATGPGFIPQLCPLSSCTTLGKLPQFPLL